MMTARGAADCFHLAYCTNVHPGETWAETFDSLNRFTLRVRDAVQPEGPFAIGLRLGNAASLELACPEVLSDFRRWLERHHCYVFTINGFPYGRFHGARVKEQVYRPDWSTPERLEYTVRLFTILADLLTAAPEGCGGSVSTLPGSFKPFCLDEEAQRAIRRNLWQCADRIEALSQAIGRDLHLGLEPEPLCLFETTPETVAFFQTLAAERPGDDRWRRFLGVNFDVCHLACQFEEPSRSLAELRAEGIRISKIHLSSALRVRPTSATREALRPFAEDVYLHQVTARAGEGLRRYRDLAELLQLPPDPAETEWRIHFHVPLHMEETAMFGNTADGNRRVLAALRADPALCRHLEMETYTWGVLPPELRSRDVVDQLSAEYRWCLAELGRGAE